MTQGRTWVYPCCKFRSRGISGLSWVAFVDPDHPVVAFSLLRQLGCIQDGCRRAVWVLSRANITPSKLQPLSLMTTVVILELGVIQPLHVLRQNDQKNVPG